MELKLYYNGIVRDDKNNIVAFYDKSSSHVEITGRYGFNIVSDEDEMYQVVREELKKQQKDLNN